MKPDAKKYCTAYILFWLSLPLSDELQGIDFSWAQNKLLVNIKQEEDFTFMELNYLILDFSSCRIGAEQNLRIEKVFFTIKNWNTVLSI